METSELGVGAAASMYVARQEGSRDAERCLLLCPGLPMGPTEAERAQRNYRELAERLCQDVGWTVATLDKAAFGGEAGFSVRSWLVNIQAAVQELASGGSPVWLAGFGEGGSLALCAAGMDASIAGVAALGAPADFSAWAAAPGAVLERAAELGLRARGGAAESTLAEELSELRPLELVAKIPPRPLLLIHGSEDEVVSALDARALLDAVEGQADLRILVGADHLLRHDPRAVAILAGWMDRQRV